MYAGDIKAPGLATGDSHVVNLAQSAHADSDLPPTSESGPVLEVIEMANGDTIWFVVVNIYIGGADI
jgi:hypothetical protein